MLTTHPEHAKHAEVKEKLEYDIDDFLNKLCEPFLNFHNEPHVVEFIETGESVVIPGPCNLCALPDGTFIVKPVLAPGTQDAVHEIAEENIDEKENHNAITEFLRCCSPGRHSSP